MGEQLRKAAYKGDVVIGNIRIPCAVLDNGKRVLSETGITHAILGTASGASRRLKKEHQEAGAPLPVFIAPKNLKPFVDKALDVGSLDPILYLDGKRTVSGYDASILPTVCDIWLNAREANILQKQQLDKALKAEILMRGLAHTGIIALIDEATGYQEVREKDALQKLLAIYLTDERLKWAKMFPDEYYRQLFRLRKWNYDPLDTHRPRLVGKLTNQLVYEKLPPGVLDELKKLNPVKNKQSGRREATHHQHLSTDIGQKDLRDHLMQLIAIMRISSSWEIFKKNFQKAFPPSSGIQEELFEEEDL
ncbi:P63C domain-containing protein [Desulfosporosinus youngiae]|uniref:p63C domain protein n=1 Tax=Desulfosporosinus youngiae DSM 17734 TaxID=768710 RepID=H5XZR7_9FIRM|nr:P63C domain-containing protein [Desulfosporosinus youngiae]EHQ92113.1 P63C domain protein [Desulfosporosinus youngiae DSM 17734]